MGILLLVSGFLALAIVVHGRSQQGFISIDCGLSTGADYTDDETQISYTSDQAFIDTGKDYNVSEEFFSMYEHEKQFMNVRSFPEGDRNCYTLMPEQGNSSQYLIRAQFMYGNYDSKNRLPEFELHLGTDVWVTVKIQNSSIAFSSDIVYAPKTNYIDVCLVDIGSGTPFISVLELRPLDNGIYNKTEPGSLLLFGRWDFGADQEGTIRDEDDVFDRIWSPFLRFNGWKAVEAPYVSSSLSGNDFKPPETVMATAVTRASATEALGFSLNVSDNPSQKLYVYMHFAEVEELKDELREFTISLNGDKSWGNGPLVPELLSPTTLYSTESVRGSTTNGISFLLNKTERSKHPPIINALEVYEIIDISTSSTVPGNVDAMKKIKSEYGMSRNWQGDPCLPKAYIWNGLDCSMSDSPSIISLNLSSSNLTGKLDSSFSGLTSLQYLDLSYNCLTGQIPYFLAEMSSLISLNLSGNNFTGAVPMALLRKSDEGSLSLSLDGNPYLCEKNLCAEAEKQKKNKNKNVTVPVVAAIIAIASVLVLLVALTTLWRFKIRRKHVIKDKTKEPEMMPSDLKNQHFSYSEVVSITDNFQKVIGKGGFGAVYSGHLENGTQVAVKMLSPSSTQGSQQFRTEAQLLARVHHRNLTALIGYCDEGSNMGLIYEYMAKGNLQEHLSGKHESPLIWEQRLRIALDAAQALEYLHYGCKPPIIHRDVKSANILLNEKLEAKVGDFGLSRIIPLEAGSHVSTAVAGTPGYLDPEYYATMQLNEKSDVYSFGIVLLELISGQSAIINSHGHRDHIVQWASPIISTGEIRKIVDPRLGGDFMINSVWKAVETAMACVPSRASQRLTMTEVVGELKECLNVEVGNKRACSMKGDCGKLSSKSPELVCIGICDKDAALMVPRAR